MREILKYLALRNFLFEQIYFDKTGVYFKRTSKA